jgi:uncharacterized protein (DUF2147 family)
MVGKYAFVLLLVSIANVSVASDAIEGVWITADGDGLVEFRFLDEQLGGVIAGSHSDPDHTKPARYDDLNPDPGLRERPLLGLAIVTNLLSSGNNKWKGRVYDPNTGKTYKCTITLVDSNTLKLRGYIGFSLLGETRVWTRKQSGVTKTGS